MVANQRALAEQKLNAYSDSALYAVSFAEALYRNPDRYPEREVPLPRLPGSDGERIES